jgi:predicted Fe-S protein YdhL (DUF1289 family)
VIKDVVARVKTPCIGVCSTGIGDSVCRGCKRFAHEVIHWNGYTDTEKRIIDYRLAQFLAQIVAIKLRVVNPRLLQSQLESQQILFPIDKSPYIWAYELLRAGASQISSLADYGLALDAQQRETNLPDLKLAIDAEFFLLSEAHYDRYFPSPTLTPRQPSIETDSLGSL